MRLRGQLFVGAAMGQALAPTPPRRGRGFSELEWAPGSAQVDFGQALAVVAGVERTVHFLVVSFPYSNMRYVAALPGETAECVCHGLNKVFSHAGMVPRVLVFDNATGVGHRRADGTVTQTRLFSLFCAHYGFETRFCNPYSGWEKGSTENAVGFLRRNLMVPTPSAEDGTGSRTRGWNAATRSRAASTTARTCRSGTCSRRTSTTCSRCRRPCSTRATGAG